MVLESLISAEHAERRPIDMIPISFLYCSVAVFLALWVFPSYLMSSAVVFLTVMAALPLMLGVINKEKDDQESCKGEIVCQAKCHNDAIPFFVMMFVGMVLAYTFWFVALPSSVVSNLFNSQLNTIVGINSAITGRAIGGAYFNAILSNNLKVMLFCIIFSFIYGAGAIFILTWNASVISAAIGNAIRSAISISGMSYFTAFSLGMLRYMTHGIFEITAYFIAGIAGGMISVAMVRHDTKHPHFRETLADVAVLTLLAIGVLILAAVVEVVISPKIPI